MMGMVDAAVGSSAGIGILLAKGDGTFQPASFFSSGAAVVAAAGDLNGDGKVDLIVSGGSVQVFLGNGDGTFQAPLPSPTGPAVIGMVTAR
jgi:hypothetical protein